MRLLALALIGCGGSWQTPPPEGCTTSPYFLDADGDGWGTGAALDQCGPAQAPYTATNDLDCDDSDAAITGKVGDSCPADLVAGPADVTGFGYASSEYVVTSSPSADSSRRIGRRHR